MSQWKLLGYLGLTPFVIGLALLPIDMPIAGLAQSTVFIGYSAIILSFMAGTMWQPDNSNQGSVRIVSNVFSLLGFAALLIAPIVGPSLAIVILALGYASLYVYERAKQPGAAQNSESIDDAKQVEVKNVEVNHYMLMRKRLTIAVVSFHIVAWLLLVL